MARGVQSPSEAVQTKCSPKQQRCSGSFVLAEHEDSEPHDIESMVFMALLEPWEEAETHWSW